jgi:hypothetical protein
MLSSQKCVSYRGSQGGLRNIELGSCSRYIAQIGLELPRSPCLSLLSAGIIGMHHHTWPCVKLKCGYEYLGIL